MLAEPGFALPVRLIARLRPLVGCGLRLWLAILLAFPASREVRPAAEGAGAGPAASAGTRLKSTPRSTHLRPASTASRTAARPPLHLAPPPALSASPPVLPANGTEAPAGAVGRVLPIRLNRPQYSGTPPPVARAA